MGHSGSPGGAEWCLDTTLRHLDRRRYLPAAVFGWEGPMADSARAMGIAVDVLPLAWWMCYEPSLWHLKNFLAGSLPRIWRLLRRIRRDKIELVYTNTAVVFEAAVAAWLAGVPHVWHVHEVLTPQYMRPRMLPLALIVRLIGWLSDRVIFESDSARRVCEQVLGKQKCVTVYNSHRFALPLPEGVGADQPFPSQERPGHCRVVWIGRFSERKDPLMLLRTIPRMQQAQYAEFLFAGEGPLEAQMRTTIDQLDLKDRCRLLPFQEDVRPLLASADVLVLTSREESFGLVLVEAGAYGKPVVATRTQGPAEIVVDGQTGFLVDPGDEAALAARLDQLIADPQQRWALGRAGAARVAQWFSPEKNTRKIEAVLEELLGDRQSKSVSDVCRQSNV